MAGVETFLRGNVIDVLLSEKTKAIMVIGGSDTGKTTLVEAIAGLLSRKTETAVLDLDMGQSHIGPPTTMGWGRVKGGFSGWQAVKAEDIYFTGTLSPPGNLLPSVTGARHLLDTASSKCPKVVIDTTGLIGEPVGRVLKQYKIDALSPDIVIALERADELEQIIEAFRSHIKPVFHRVAVPDEVAFKSTVKRADFRTEKLREYFKGAISREFSLEEKGIRFTRELNRDELVGRAVSFRDKSNEDIFIGILESIDLARKKAAIRTPATGAIDFTTLVIGTAAINLSEPSIS